MQIAILIIFILAVFYTVKFLTKKKVTVTDPVPVLLKKILEEQVPFYQQLTQVKQAEFEERAALFLTQVKIVRHALQIRFVLPGLTADKKEPALPVFF